jgi:hypothetical protein
MTESGKVTAWVAVKVELESRELWPEDFPCSEACTYEHEHEYAGECTEGCAGDCDVDHPDYTGPCNDPRQCRDPSYDHLASEGHRPDWSQADLSRAMLEQMARDYESGYDVVDPETHQYVRAGDLRIGPDRVEAWRWKAVPGTARVLARIEPAVTLAVTDRSCACGCGRPVTSPRPEARYATGACRVRAHRAR